MIRRSCNLLCAWLLVVGFGCTPKRPKAPSKGTYGVLTNEPSQNVVPARSDEAAKQPWTNGELAIIQTEFSPATLLHCQAKTLSVFENMAETGIGGPTFAAIETEQGPKIFKPGEQIDPARMRESWFAVWWAGASGWTNWDSPWFLTLQHRPAKIQFDTNGLHFTFSAEAGYAALMPMYGYYKPMQAGTSPPFPLPKDKKKRVLTWEWFKALPADPLARARYWASALREFPISCEERFSVDRAHDSVTIRQSFRWLSWNDDWNTRHLKLAPVSPVLAHAHKEGFPAEFSKKPFDMEILTPFGPYYGIENVDSYDVTLPVLRYVHETEGVGPKTVAESDAPCFAMWQQAHRSGDWESIRQRWPALREEFRRASVTDWAAFGAPNGGSPLEQTANALGAARVAYRLGDADTYVEACQFFARALTQLCAQQRGLKYFREWQPWHSMEPIAVDAALRLMTKQGWQIERTVSATDLSTAPDLATIWRDAPAASKERESSQPAVKLERLISGGGATPFILHRAAKFPRSHPFLVYDIVNESQRQQSRGDAPGWPRLIWPDWKTTTGAPWNFGQMAASTNSPARIEPRALSESVLLHLFW